MYALYTWLQVFRDKPHPPFVGVHVEINEPQAISDIGVGGTLQWRQLLVALIGREG